MKVASAYRFGDEREFRVTVSDLEMHAFRRSSAAIAYDRLREAIEAHAPKQVQRFTWFYRRGKAMPNVG